MVKHPSANARDVEMQVQSLGQGDPLEEAMASHSRILGDSHGQRSLVGYSPKGLKELDTTVVSYHANTHTG